MTQYSQKSLDGTRSVWQNRPRNVQTSTPQYTFPLYTVHATVTRPSTCRSMNIVKMTRHTWNTTRAEFPRLKEEIIFKFEGLIGGKVSIYLSILSTY